MSYSIKTLFLCIEAACAIASVASENGITPPYTENIPTEKPTPNIASYGNQNREDRSLKRIQSTPEQNTYIDGNDWSPIEDTDNPQASIEDLIFEEPVVADKAETTKIEPIEDPALADENSEISDIPDKAADGFLGEENYDEMAPDDEPPLDQIEQSHLMDRAADQEAADQKAEKSFRKTVEVFGEELEESPQHAERASFKIPAEELHDLLAPKKPTSRKIVAVAIEGNEYVPTETIRDKIPYQLGDTFDKSLSHRTIHSLYALGFFKNVELFTEEVGKAEIRIYVVVSEKPRVAEFKFNGNKHFAAKTLKKRLNLDSLKAADTAELEHLSKKIERLYLEKGYYKVRVSGEIEPVPETQNTVNVIFNVREGKKTPIQRVFIKGNVQAVPTDLIKKSLMTKEEWCFSFIGDGTGVYHPDAIEMDKQTIENIYQNRGYIEAAVADVNVDLDETKNVFNITFSISEGKQYIVSDVSIPGNEILSKEELALLVPIRPGQVYARDNIRDSIESLRKIWGEHGYIYADIEPIIIPNSENGTVSVTLKSDIGKKIQLNRIEISGNRKARDHVIRRQLSIHEGDVITTSKMDESKDRVSLLGYFDERAGVNWRINRITDDLADLELMLKERRTGRANWTFGYGMSPHGNVNLPSGSLNGGVTITESNLMGRGIRVSASTQISKEWKTVEFSIMDPWMFNKPVIGAFEGYYKGVNYDDLVHFRRVTEKFGGATVKAGFNVPLAGNFNFITDIGWQTIRYASGMSADSGKAPDHTLTLENEKLMEAMFKPCSFGLVGFTLSQDTRNHPMHPTHGSNIRFAAHLALPLENDASFFKVEGEATWYTPLIGDFDLILCLRGTGGWISPISGKHIPYSELFHVGGPQSLRGFDFGQAGPTWQGDSIGATKMALLTAELIFPITRDFNMKGVLFYNGGGGWDSPYNRLDLVEPDHVKSDYFEFRQSVGIGVRMLSPTPVAVDWAFRLDAKPGEPSHKLHLSGYYTF